jgi:glycerate kinase
MRVLVAPDKFRGTLTAAQAADAIATGWRRARPSDTVDEVPMADGGEGTLEAIVAGLGGERIHATVTGPLGDPVASAFGIVETVSGPTGIVELAGASGLGLLTERRRDPLRASTRGTGELLLAACRAQVREIVIAIGGSASTDGGAGIASALGVRLLNDRDEPIRPGGIGLLELARIDVRGLDPAARGVRFVAAVDVDAPLLGPTGAARVFGPQKGADPDDVLLLERALGHLAAVVHHDLGVDVREIPGAGAAGGAGAGLVAVLGARIRPGVDIVIETVGLDARVGAADLVITGEGRLDAFSLRGKVVSGILDRARRHRVPAAILCGRADVAVDGVLVGSLAERFGEERSRSQAARLLGDLAEEIAIDIGSVSSPA